MLERAFGKIRDGLLSIAYPIQCKICGEMIDSWDDGIVCRMCWDDTSNTTLFFNKPVCDKCGIPITWSPTNSTCGRCDVLEYASARACGFYTKALEASILLLKTHPHVCPRLRSLIVKTFSDNRASLACDLVIPIPLHSKRRRERGFNQAEIIARVISSKFLIPLNTNSLVRIKYTEQHRAGIDAIERARSVEHAFKITRPHFVQGASILLVDDVYTTGSTTLAAVRTLLGAGAARVSVLTIARVASATQRR